MKRYNVTRFGIAPNTDELITNKLQKLIDDIEEGEIYFPKGKYTLSTIFLKNNITINLARGAVILGSLNFSDYHELEKINYPLYQDVSHSYFYCSLFVGISCKNITFKGYGKIDMQSIWDEENICDNVHRGPKCIALKECENVIIKDIRIRNATDLAIYFAHCNNVLVDNVNLKVYIDGISPDNSQNIIIKNCKIVSGDDGIVLKSSYNLDKLGECRDIKVTNCDIQSRCNALKFGTESNGGFVNVEIDNIRIKNTRITGISIESVDGAHIDNINIHNIKMTNVNAPLFIHLGNRLRGPQGSTIGKISNISLKNIIASGPYKTYKTIPWNYISFRNNDVIQKYWAFGSAENIANLKCKKREPWQFTSNICGYKDNYLENISLENVHLELFGGVKDFSKEVKEDAGGYPEVYVYGRILPASGIYFRHIKNLNLNNVSIKNIHSDNRDILYFDDVLNLKID